jgi:hypothetical protein
MAPDVTQRDHRHRSGPDGRARAAPREAAQAAPATHETAAALGSWAASLAAALTLAFVALTVASTVGGAGGDAGALLQISQLLPVLMLAPVVVVLAASLHALAPAGRRLFSHVAVTFSGVYAAIIVTNYFIQFVVARPRLAAGEGEALGLVAMSTPASIFTALEAAGYGFFAMMALFLAPVFAGRGIERWIRRLFVATGVTGMVGAAAAIAGQPIVMMSGFGLSLLAFLAVVVLLAVRLSGAGGRGLAMVRRRALETP